MANFSIPNNSQIRQLNRYEDEGEIIESYNLNLSKKLGKINVSSKVVKVLNESDVDDEIIYVLANYAGRYYILTDQEAYTCNILNDPTDSDNWVLEEELDPIGVGGESDAVVFDGKLIITTDTDMTSWNGSIDDDDWWTNVVSGTALTANYPHILHVHRGGQETLFVTDKNLVRYYNASAGHSTITLQTDLVASCITSGVSAIWVGTYTEDLDNAYVYEVYVGEQIDGAPVARNAYKIDGRAVLSIETIDNIPYIITDRGNLQVFNGAGFTTVATLPFAGSNISLAGALAGSIQDSNDLRPVHPKGMVRHEDSLLINLNSLTNDGHYPDHTPSGVWEFDIETKQLTHRYSYAETTDDAGGYMLDRVGPILVPNSQYTMILSLATTFNGLSALFANSDSIPQAHFITKEIESDSVQDAWESVYQKAKTLGAGESIELKYRTSKRDKIFADCIYQGASVINTLADVTGIEVGDEVTDTATGLVAHISQIDTTSATVTSITLDRDLGVDGDAHLIEFQNFKLEPSVYTSTDEEWKRQGGFESSPWIQFKVVMYGRVEYRSFTCKSNSKTGT